MSHSTPLSASVRLPSDSVPPRLSFDRSQCSLPPLELGEEDAPSLPSVGIPIQAGAPFVTGPIPLHSTSVSALNLTADQTKIIFNLACEGRHLKERVTREFVRLSSQEVLFRTQAQSTSHETLASGRPDRFSTYCQILRSEQESLDTHDKAMEEVISAAGQAWSQANAGLFNHILDYEKKMNAFLDRTGGWIWEQEERIWTAVFQIAGDTGAPLCAMLDIVFCLLDTLPSFPPNLSYQRQSPVLCGFAPEAYAQLWLGLHSLKLPHPPSFDSRRKAEDVLKDAIVCSTQSGAVASARVIPPAPASTSTVHVPRNAGTLLLQGLPPTPPPAAHSPSKRKCAKSPSPQRLQSGASSSGESSASGRGSRGSQLSSSSSSGSSSRSSSGSGSQSGSLARSEASAGMRSVHSVAASVGSVEVLSGDEVGEGENDVSYSTEDADVSQGSIPLLDISVTDDDDTRKRKARELACKSDTAFTTWKEKQISEGVKGIEEWEQMVNDYADGRRRPKHPDPLGPPNSYMVEHGVFQPLASPTNTLGLCRFYHVDSDASMLATPTLPATVNHIEKLLLLASTQGWRYVLMVFKGGTVTPLGLSQELHTRSALVRIPIHVPGEAKDGHGPRVSCCPFCTYTIQNDPAYLNHIVCAHYDVSFACGGCLNTVTSSGQQMKSHIKECTGLAPPPAASQESAPGGHLPKKSAPDSKQV